MIFNLAFFKHHWFAEYIEFTEFPLHLGKTPLLHYCLQRGTSSQNKSTPKWAISRNISKQESIPLGGVPPARWPHPPDSWDADSRMQTPWSCDQWCILGSQPPWTEVHTGVKKLPCPKLHLQVVTIKHSSRMHTPAFLVPGSLPTRPPMQIWGGLPNTLRYRPSRGLPNPPNADLQGFMQTQPMHTLENLFNSP